MSENNSQNEINQNEGDEIKEQKSQIRQAFATSNKFHPIKARIRQMEKDIADLRQGLNENKKSGMMIKGDLSAIEGTIKEKCNDLCKCIMDDLANFEKDLKRVIQNDRTEIDFFKVQTNSLNDDKIKLQKETIHLQSRMRACEIDIGVDPQ